MRVVLFLSRVLFDHYQLKIGVDPRGVYDKSNLMRIAIIKKSVPCLVLRGFNMYDISV